MSRRVAALTALVVATGLGACQRADEQAAETEATTLTVYASLPLQGPAGPGSEAVANGERLALRQAGGRAGDLTIKLVVLDDSTPASQRWDANQTADNARTAVRDKGAIAYLGDADSGATAISLPVLNAGGVPQVSPTSTYAGLTRAGTEKGEPEKYYPAGTRTFARTAPSDRFQGAALVALMQQKGCRTLEVLDDRDVFGRGLAATVEAAAETTGLAVGDRKSLRADADPDGVAADVAERAPDCVMFAGSAAPWVPTLFDALHRARPAMQLFGGDGLATDGFAGALQPGTQARTHFTTLEQPPAAAGSAGARFAKAYSDAFGNAPTAGAAYGYEAMRLVLAAIARAGPEGGNRTAVARQLFKLGRRSGPLGTFSIDAVGDTSLTSYGQADARAGRIVVRAVAPAPEP